MRPVERGPRPLNSDGTPKMYSAYSHARKDLIERIGQYCAYCNQKLPASLAVEHVQPKVLVPHLELEWENFVLGCTNCNSIKGDRPVHLTEFLWPHVHNTHLAIIYTPDGKVHVNDSLPADLQRKAQNVLDLVGLQKYPNNPTASDRRWINRKEAFVKANTALVLYSRAIAKGAANEFEKLLGSWAADNGFFSVWLTVFNNYPAVKKEIIHAFVGTAPCFDEQAQAINRTEEL